MAPSNPPLQPQVRSGFATNRHAGGSSVVFSSRPVHKEFPKVAKACPCFDAIKWAQEMGLPAAPRMRSFTASMLIETEARPEIEDGDEADPGEGSDPEFPDNSPAPTGPGKWATALFGGGGLGLFGGYGVGFPPIIILAVVGLTALAVVAFFIMIGHERRERLWEKMTAKVMGWFS